MVTAPACRAHSSVLAAFTFEPDPISIYKVECAAYSEIDKGSPAHIASWAEITKKGSMARSQKRCKKCGGRKNVGSMNVSLSITSGHCLEGIEKIKDIF